MTAFDTLLASLQKAADFNRDDTVPPAAVLWPDEKREWERLVPRLRLMLPHFLTFGPYDKANRTGPAIWLRSVLVSAKWQGLDRDRVPANQSRRTAIENR